MSGLQNPHDDHAMSATPRNSNPPKEMATESARPLVQEGDLLRINYDGSEGGSARKVTALVLAIKKASEEKQGSWFKYTLRLADTGDTIKTRLANLSWKPKTDSVGKPKELKAERGATDDADKKEKNEKKEKKASKRKAVAEEAPRYEENPQDEVRKRFRQEVRGVPKSVAERRAQFAARFPVESLRHILAPMVGASELPFRLLCRRYGATLAYTPMIHSDKFAVDEVYRQQELQVTAQDRPLVAHFAANHPQTLVSAARHAVGKCDAIDLNLGCPQRVASAGHFGSFLLDPVDRPLVLAMVRELAASVPLPVFVKIRLLDKLEDTLELVRQLYDAGASAIAIHGRYRVDLTQRSGPGARDGPAMLDQIQHICEQLPHVPIITNGNVITFDDVVQNAALTRAYGVMSAEGILDNPALFNGGLSVAKTRLALEYLELVDLHPAKLKTVVFHVRRMCKDLLIQFQLMEEVLAAESINAVKAIVHRLIAYEKDPAKFRFDAEKAKKEKEALARRKEEEGKRKEFEARMTRKAKREGKELDFYLKDGATPPSEETIEALKSMKKEEAFEFWKSHHKQHCWSFHFDANGCHRDRKCSFLHLDVKHAETEVYG